MEHYELTVLFHNTGEWGIIDAIDGEMKSAVKAAILQIAKKHKMPNFSVTFGNILIEPSVF